MFKKAVLTVAILAAGTFAAAAQQTNSSNPTQAPVTGGATPGAGAKTEQPGAAANSPGMAKQPSGAQNSSNPTQAPVAGNPSPDAKTEMPKKN